MRAALAQAAAAVKAKARWLMFTTMAALGILQILVGMVGDIFFYCLTMAVVWIALKLGAGR